MTAVEAARPALNARPQAPPSRAARFASSAKRVGFCVREYSKPLCAPGPAWAYVDVRKTGVMTAPVVGSGGWPAWMARVSSRGGAVFRLQVVLRAVGRTEVLDDGLLEEVLHRLAA